MIEGVKFAHERGRKVYVTANIFPHNNDINEILPYLQELVEVCLLYTSGFSAYHY